MSSLAVVDRAVAFACRRYGFDPDEREEFAAIVRLKLIEDDYAVLRAYEGRSSISTFLSIVVQRMALDYRVHVWGKWHASAEAKRMGTLAVELEQLLHRDGRTLDDALVILSSRHDGLTRASLAALAARLPERAARPRSVDLDAAASVAGTRGSDVEEPLLAAERRNASRHVSSIMGSLVAQLPEDERLILQLRFEGGMTVAQISRSLGLDQKLTYRRIERRMRELREELGRAGLEPREVLDLLGGDEPLVHFDFGKRESRPSIPADERASADSEGS